MEDFFWHLRTPDLFEGLPAEVKKAFFDKASLRILRKKEYVFKENEPVFSCFYLKKGIVRIFRVSKNGKEAVLFIHNDGALFGLAEIIKHVKAMRRLFLHAKYILSQERILKNFLSTIRVYLAESSIHLEVVFDISAKSLKVSW